MHMPHNIRMLVIHLTWGSLITCSPNTKSSSLLNKTNFRAGENLIEAIMHHNMAAITTLLQQYSSLANYIDYFGDSPLMKAAAEGLTSVVKQLLDAGAIVNYRSKIGYTALHRAITHAYEKPEIATMLLAHGADPDGTNHPQETPLIFAVRKTDISLATVLLKHRASPHRINQQGETPLFTAIGNPETIKLLLSYGADPNHVNHAHESPLQKAVERNKAKSALLLLQAGADPNYDIPGQCLSPVIMASLRHSPALIRILFSYGTRIPTQNQWERARKNLGLARLARIQKEIEKEKHIAQQRCNSVYSFCQDKCYLPFDLARLVQQISVEGTPKRYDLVL